MEIISHIHVTVLVRCDIIHIAGLMTLLHLLGLEAEPARVRITLARWRDGRQSSKMASTLMKNRVWRRALVSEVDLSG